MNRYEWLEFLADSLRYGNWPRLLGAREIARLYRLPRPLAWLCCLYLRAIGLGFGRRVDSVALEAWLRQRAHDLWRYPPFGLRF